jgi:hypothetical protein
MLLKNTIEYLKNIRDLPKNACIVFDIDDTLIDSRTGLLIESVFEIYQYALSNMITPIIITLRSGHQSNMEKTKKQLYHIGIRNYHSLYFNPIKNTATPFQYKTICRKDVYNDGFNTIISIGDQQWDIGDFGGVGVIVPSQH